MGSFLGYLRKFFRKNFLHTELTRNLVDRLKLLGESLINLGEKKLDSNDMVTI
jgi:hypothetical protein